MPKLHQILQMAGTAVVDFSLPPNDDGPKAVLVMRTPARPAVIATLGLEHLFDANGEMLKALSDRVSVSVELFDQMLSLPMASGAGYDNYYPEKVYKFKLLRTPEDADASAALEFRVHIRAPKGEIGKIRELLEFHLKWLKQTFECALQPRQGSLFEGGSRVDMAAAPPAQAPEPPPMAAPPDPVAPAPALASAGEMKRRYGGGAAKKKGEVIQ